MNRLYLYSALYLFKNNNPATIVTIRYTSSILCTHHFTCILKSMLDLIRIYIAYMIRFHSWFRDVLYFISKEGPCATSTQPIPPTVCEVSSCRWVLSVTSRTPCGYSTNTQWDEGCTFSKNATNASKTHYREWTFIYELLILFKIIF